MPRKRRLPDVVTLKLPTYEQPRDIFDVIFESEEARKMAEQIVEYLKKNKRMGWDEYRDLFPPEKHYLYFRVMKRMEALGLIGAEPTTLTSSQRSSAIGWSISQSSGSSRSEKSRNCGDAHDRSVYHHWLVFDFWWVKMAKVATEKRGSHSGDKPEKRRKTRLHITLDEEVVGAMTEMGINKSQFFNKTARWVFLGEEIPEVIVKLEWCGGRDLNPGHGLEGRCPRPG